ncbi:MAG: FAD-binding oxidoreductase [Pseudolabrys sp.]|nr:FAD-binding oxidoreductase [Pseudolabrys sp.]
MSLGQQPQLHRRGFLTGAAALGLAAAAPSGDGFKWAAEAEARALASVGRANWTRLANSLTGPLIRPGDSAFTRFADGYNLAYIRQERRAQGIALCASTADVALCINWARDNKVPLVARCGGHSYAGYSSTTGLMIDVSMIRGGHWSKPEEVTFGAGSRNGDLYDLLKSANRTTTHGRCPTVGAAGFLLGGGIGFNMRLHGIGSDAMTASEIVTADGTVKQLSATENEDLFWACRGGGGGNFGINTSFTLNTFPTRRITYFKAAWSGTRTEMAKVAHELMTSFEKAPREVGSRFAITAPNPIGQTKQFGVNILGQYQSDDDMTQAVLDLLGPALRAVPASQRVESWPEHPGPCVYQIAFRDYWAAQTRDLIELDGPFAFHERSTFLTHSFDADTFDHITRLMEGWRGSDDRGSHHINADIRFFQTGGAINDMRADETAYVHRDNVWLADIGLPWTARDGQARLAANVRWMNGLYEELLKLTACNRHAYQNFADPMRKDYESAYYGANLARLRRIKAQHDPGNLFAFPQQIRPA